MFLLNDTNILTDSEIIIAWLAMIPVIAGDYIDNKKTFTKQLSYQYPLIQTTQSPNLLINVFTDYLIICFMASAVISAVASWE